MASPQEIQLLWERFQIHRKLVTDFADYYPSRYWMQTTLGRQVWHNEWMETRDALKQIALTADRLQRAAQVTT